MRAALSNSEFAASQLEPPLDLRVLALDCSREALEAWCEHTSLIAAAFAAQCAAPSTRLVTCNPAGALILDAVARALAASHARFFRNDTLNPSMLARIPNSAYKQGVLDAGLAIEARAAFSARPETWW